jgi:Fur family transcriptional regulator, peroxide stress response regulator
VTPPLSRLDELVHTLRAQGGRMTPQRMAILRALLTGDHPTIEEIYATVKRDFPMTSLVTVYRTLATLREAGEVLGVKLGDPSAHYDGARPYPHPHLVCLRCGRVTDAPDVDTRTLTAEIARRAADWTLSQETQFYGVCPACRAREASGARKEAGHKT